MVGRTLLSAAFALDFRASKSWLDARIHPRPRTEINFKGGG